MKMTKENALHLLNCIHPHFFEGEEIKKLSEEDVFREMLLPLEEFNPDLYDKKMPENVSFGYYKGTLADLKKMVAKVDEQWLEFFGKTDVVYCGYVDGKLASFCIVEEMGTHNLKGRTVKVGGPGCVGTLPEFRNSGIGLTMVKQVTQILKEQGCDYSYIHFTAVAPWYAKLGYEVSLTWNKKGAL